MTPTTLVVGGSAASRERAIAAAIASFSDPDLSAVALLEGLPDASGGSAALLAGDRLQIVRIAPGCPCCIGNLTLRVTLNRILRRPPAQLYIGLASTLHLAQIRQFLSQPPYDAWLQLNQDLPV